ncbi:MAG: beta-N-acetylhexosaminidase [Magnetococcales bacterium]|nr:beta-N-acetylhexosaminidase [Magnetococcales bacterium]
MKPQTTPAHHLILGISGTILTKDEKQWLETNKPSGIILFSRNIENLEQVRALINAICKTATPPPTIWIDQEGGRVQRLRAPFTNFPSPYRFAQLFREDKKAGLEMSHLGGMVCGLELASIGIGVNCAPVLDIRQKEADPVIGNRAFGTTAEEVIKLSGAWIRGIGKTGVMAVGKHFPGHGAAQVDSHKQLPTITKSREELDNHELKPFKALAATLPALMTAHLIAEGLDIKQPATWSSPTLKKLLRTDWGFKGLIVSDAVEMGALQGDLADRVYNSLLGGCDLVLCCTGRLEDNHAALEGAIRGVIAMENQELLKSRERIRTILTPYQRPAEKSLNSDEYTNAKKRLEALAETVLDDDPTEIG